jgi:hypothetical protein
MGTPNASRVLLYSMAPRRPASAAPAISADSALSPRASHRSMASGDGALPTLASVSSWVSRSRYSGRDSSAESSRSSFASSTGTLMTSPDPAASASTVR